MSGMHKSGLHKKLAFQKAIGNIEQLTTLKRSKVIGVAYIRANVPKKQQKCLNRRRANAPKKGEKSCEEYKVDKHTGN